MEASNAVAVALALSPLSLLSKPPLPPKKLSPPAVSLFRHHTSRIFGASARDLCSRRLNHGLLFLSSILSSESVKALTYDEALDQSGSSGVTLDFDINGIIDSVVNFTNENPLIVGGGAAAVVLPVVIAQLIGQSRPWGAVSAKNAYAKLSEDPNAQLLDIRLAADIRQEGSPDLKGLKKKPVAIVYKGDNKPGFLKKLSVKFKEPNETTLFILDKFSGNSELVAELVTANGFKAAFAIRDGAEGPSGWKNSGLPWLLPSKALINFGGLTDALAEASDAAPLTLGIAAAAAGLGLLAFTEVETVLQVLGTAAVVQFVSKKLLFAEDRKQTIQQIEELLNTKVAPKELTSDIQEIGKALLPPVTISKAAPALPASTEPSLAPPVEKSESKPETITEVNSIPNAEIQEESLPRHPTSLSPYPNYPDYKPPSSPMPSQP
ncbi:rhodanese-like domain-containing protein 4, chloroplastic [Andrographis paniculata]|uniref:rhodanese-like domain-containing protein 4, chloroplastic n=1 Tax=Andrographis paniculata TaxID=175694 RepID=UPI0021E97830|nr:rhodanese-like domain-containing protein 4, chloroplastic [Andrographis paniculata]